MKTYADVAFASILYIASVILAVTGRTCLQHSVFIYRRKKRRTNLKRCDDKKNYKSLDIDFLWVQSTGPMNPQIGRYGHCTIHLIAMFTPLAQWICSTVFVWSVLYLYGTFSNCTLCPSCGCRWPVSSNILEETVFKSQNQCFVRSSLASFLWGVCQGKIF